MSFNILRSAAKDNRDKPEVTAAYDAYLTTAVQRTREVVAQLAQKSTPSAEL